MTPPTRKQVEQARCLVDGHEWETDRYVDVQTPTGAIVMAGWMRLVCRCGEKRQIVNPGADWPVSDG